jgi:hypothetical protein
MYVRNLITKQGLETPDLNVLNFLENTCIKIIKMINNNMHKINLSAKMGTKISDSRRVLHVPCFLLVSCLTLRSGLVLSPERSASRYHNTQHYNPEDSRCLSASFGTIQELAVMLALCMYVCMYV